VRSIRTDRFGAIRFISFILVPAPTTNLDDRLRDMDAMGVDVQVLSPSPNQYYYWAEYDPAAEKFPAFITALYSISQGRAVPSPGGALILDKDGDVIGAVGVSGDTGDNDELCALTGVAAAGYRAAPGLVESDCCW
jgi:hypothetical protein